MIEIKHNIDILFKIICCIFIKIIVKTTHN